MDNTNILTTIDADGGLPTEATFKQMDTAATELQCFNVLQKQELLTSTLRVNGLVDKVNKQRALESLQSRYADLLAEHDGLKRKSPESGGRHRESGRSAS